MGTLQCKIQDCTGKPFNNNGKLSLIKGMCSAHYAQTRRHGRITKETIENYDLSGISPDAMELRSIYSGINQRCNKPKSKNYRYYGHKGISLSAEWSGYSGFKTFSAYVINNLGVRPSNKHSIDRVDNTKGYEPGNIRWATPHMQALNRGVLKNSRSGITGVRPLPNGKYSASLNFRGKRVLDKICNDKEEAVQLRRLAEATYFLPVFTTN